MNNLNCDNKYDRFAVIHTIKMNTVSNENQISYSFFNNSRAFNWYFYTVISLNNPAR